MSPVVRIKKTLLEAVDGAVAIRARASSAISGRKFDARKQAHRSNVDDVRRASEAMDGGLPTLSQFASARQ